MLLNSRDSRVLGLVATGTDVTAIRFLPAWMSIRVAEWGDDVHPQRGTARDRSKSAISLVAGII